MLVLCLAVAPLFAVEVPAGVELSVRLQTAVSASAGKSDQAVEAVTIAPALDRDGAVLIPSGSNVSGKVKERKAAEDGKGRARLRLVFDRVSSRGGGTAKLDARVLDVDNARETVDEQGAILGVLASESLSARIDAGIGKLAERYPALGGILAGVKAGVVNETDADIRYEPGVEMRLRIEKAFQWHPGKGAAAQTNAIAGEEELTRMVNSQPFRTASQNPPNPSDITNLMFIGTRRQIESAFGAAGWTTAHALSGESTLETLRAVIEMRGYKEAPVSLLTLDGRPPDLVFQKQNNTFAQRHHLRIWSRPDVFNDRPVWVCAATHDIAIDFSEESRTFVHRIDPRIDDERAKVANDLLFTGAVTALSLIDRAEVPKRSRNGTGDELTTDGRMAVLQF